MRRQEGGKRRQKLIRRLKSNKDERTVPMSKALYEAIKDIQLIKGSDDPIWANRYKENDDSWVPTIAQNIKINMVYHHMT